MHNDIIYWLCIYVFCSLSLLCFCKYIYIYVFFNQYSTYIYIYVYIYMYIYIHIYIYIFVVHVFLHRIMRHLHLLPGLAEPCRTVPETERTCAGCSCWRVDSSVGCPGQSALSCLEPQLYDLDEVLMGRKTLMYLSIYYVLYYVYIYIH